MTIAERNRKLWEAIKKGDLTVADLISDGGYLPAEQEMRFMRKLYASTPFLEAIRKVTMNAPVRKINKIGITGNFLVGAPSSGTALDASKRNKVFTEQVTLTTSEFLGSMYIPYDVIEDNIEGAALESTLLDEILPQKAGRDLEKWIIQGDTTSSDTLLSKADGVMKQLSTGSNVLTYTDVTGGIDDILLADIIEYLPYEYRENEDLLRYFFHQSVSDAYNKWQRARLTALGDNAIMGAQMRMETFRGVPLIKTSRMPRAQGLLTNPQNIILGTQRGLQIETARDIEARVIVIVMTIRCAIGIEEKSACVKATGLNPSGTTTTSTTTTSTTT